jgi:hypothetical protein
VEVGRSFENRIELNRRAVQEREAQLRSIVSEMASLTAQVPRAHEEVKAQYQDAGRGG